MKIKSAKVSTSYKLVSYEKTYSTTDINNMSKARKIHKLPSIEDMSEEEFNKMLEEAYEQAKKGKGRPANKVLNEIRNEIKTDK